MKVLGLLSGQSPRDIATFPVRSRENILRKAETIKKFREASSIKLTPAISESMPAAAEGKHEVVSSTHLPGSSSPTYAVVVHSPPKPPSQISPVQSVANNSSVLVPDSQDSISNNPVASQVYYGSPVVSTSVPESQADCSSADQPNTSIPCATVSRVQNAIYIPLSLSVYPTCSEQGCNFVIVADWL